MAFDTDHETLALLHYDVMVGKVSILMSHSTTDKLHVTILAHLLKYINKQEKKFSEEYKTSGKNSLHYQKSSSQNLWLRYKTQGCPI